MSRIAREQIRCGFVMNIPYDSQQIPGVIFIVLACEFERGSVGLQHRHRSLQVNTRFAPFFENLPDYLAENFEIWQYFANFATLNEHFNICKIFAEFSRKLLIFQTDFLRKF